MSFRFDGDKDIVRVKKQIEDNFADMKTVEGKSEKVKTLKTSVPDKKDLSDGDTVLYDDGTNVYRYYKSGGRLFRQQLTEV